MYNANYAAAMESYLAEKGLVTDFELWRAQKEANKVSAKPEIYVEYTFVFSRRDKREDINITPWLRTASIGDLKRFMNINYNDLMESDHPDYTFVDLIMQGLLDADEKDMHFSALETTIHFFDLHDQIRKHLPELRPHDHDQV